MFKSTPLLVDPADPGASSKFLGPEALRGVGGILLNHHGARFVNELGRRDDVTNAMYSFCALPGASMSQSERGEATTPAPVHAFILLSEAAAASFGPNFGFYLKVKKFFTEVAGAAGVAAYIGGDATSEGIASTLATYAAAARGETADAFGKTAFPDAFAGGADARMYIARVTPSIHYTMGGVATNAAGELLYADASEVERRAAMTASLRNEDGGAASVVDYSTGSPIRVDATASSPSADTRFDLPATVASMDLAHAAPDELSRIAVDADARDWGMFEMPALRPIPRLFGAGEVTGGLHGGNRLAGNSLLECAVFGRIAGARAAAVSRSDAPALSPDAFTPLRFRESHRVCTSVYLFRFDLPSPLQCTGLRDGEYVAVRAVLAGAETVRFYSPISRSDALGHIDLLLKVDAAGGAMTTHVNSLKPGDTLEVKGPMGGPRIDLRPGHDLGRVKRIGMICGGTGIAAMSQILRSAFHHSREDIPIRMLYAAGTPDQLAFYPLLQRKALLHRNFELYCAVEKVPAGMDWTGHVGFINEDMLRAHMFAPSDDLLIIMCGPGPMCRALKATLARMNYTPDMIFSYM